MSAVTDWPALWAMADFGEGQPAAAVEPQPQRTAAGRERCTSRAKSTGRRCGRWPVPGATVCVMHGGAAPQVRAKAAQRLQEAKALELARSAGHQPGDGFDGDPLAALQWVIGESHYMTQRLAGIVRSLTDADLRYSGKMGEQTRGELTALLRSMKDLSSMSERAISLGIDARAAQIGDLQLAAMERALNAGLSASGISLENREKAIEVLRRELRRPIPAPPLKVIKGGVAE
jgi:hypothetical protein